MTLFKGFKDAVKKDPLGTAWRLLTLPIVFMTFLVSSFSVGCASALFTLSFKDGLESAKEVYDLGF